MTSTKSTKLYSASVRVAHSYMGSTSSYRVIKEDATSLSGSDLNRSQPGQTCPPFRKRVKEKVKEMEAMAFADRTREEN